MLSNKCPTTQSPVIPLGLLLLVMLEGRGRQKHSALTGCRHTSGSADRPRMWLRKCNEGKGDDAVGFVRWCVGKPRKELMCFKDFRKEVELYRLFVLVTVFVKG